MKIYVVEGGWDYEGSEIVKVFASKESADRYAEKMRKSGDRCYDYYNVSEHKVNA